VDRGEGHEPEGLALAQAQEPGDVVDVGARDDDGADRGIAQRTAGPKGRIVTDLLRQVGRGVEERPGAVIAGDGDARLGARRDARVAVPGERADGTAAIPLREAAAGRGAEDERLRFGAGRRAPSLTYRRTSSSPDM
jgi:hypothetical protein